MTIRRKTTIHATSRTPYEVRSQPAQPVKREPWMIPGGRWKVTKPGLRSAKYHPGRITRPGNEPNTDEVYLLPTDTFIARGMDIKVRDWPASAPIADWRVRFWPMGIIAASLFKRGEQLPPRYSYSYLPTGYKIEHLDAITALDPMIGLAPSGTSPFALDKAKRARWLKRWGIINALANRNSWQGMTRVHEQYDGMMKRLGLKVSDLVTPWHSETASLLRYVTA